MFTILFICYRSAYPSHNAVGKKEMFMPHDAFYTYFLPAVFKNDFFTIKGPLSLVLFQSFNYEAIKSENVGFSPE